MSFSHTFHSQQRHTEHVHRSWQNASTGNFTLFLIASAVVLEITSIPTRPALTLWFTQTLGQICSTRIQQQQDAFTMATVWWCTSSWAFRQSIRHSDATYDLTLTWVAVKLATGAYSSLSHAAWYIDVILTSRRFMLYCTFGWCALQCTVLKGPRLLYILLGGVLETTQQLLKRTSSEGRSTPGHSGVLTSTV